MQDKQYIQAKFTNIATGETSPAITSFYFFGYSNFSNFYHLITFITDIAAILLQCRAVGLRQGATIFLQEG